MSTVKARALEPKILFVSSANNETLETMRVRPMAYGAKTYALSDHQFLGLADSPPDRHVWLTHLLVPQHLLNTNLTSAFDGYI